MYNIKNPFMGRWLSRDPLGEAGGVNLYAFAGNDPLNFFDPLGLSWGDKSANYWTVVGGMMVDPASWKANLSMTWDNVASGDSGATLSAYSHKVITAPVNLVEGAWGLLSDLPGTVTGLWNLPGMIGAGLGSGQLKCLLGAKWDSFQRSSPEDQMAMLGDWPAPPPATGPPAPPPSRVLNPFVVVRVFCQSLIGE